MYKIQNTSCRKCGSDTRIHWDSGEESSGMDIKPLRPSGMIKSCLNCGYSEKINDLDNRENASKLE